MDDITGLPLEEDDLSVKESPFSGVTRGTWRRFRKHPGAIIGSGIFLIFDSIGRSCASFSV